MTWAGVLCESWKRRCLQGAINNDKKTFLLLDLLDYGQRAESLSIYRLIAEEGKANL
jgi:hypothetical protein